MAVSHVAAGEAGAGQIGCPEHIPPGLQIAAVFVSPLQIGEDELHGLDGPGPGLDGGGTADVGLHGVGQGVDAGGGGDGFGQTDGGLGIHDRVFGDEIEVVHGDLVPGGVVGDDRGQSGLAAGSRSGGNGEDGRQPVEDPQVAAHGFEAPFGASGPGSGGLGTVHGGAAAEPDDSPAIVALIEDKRRLNHGKGGVGKRAVVDGAADAGVFHGLFQGSRQAEIPDGLVRDQQRRGDADLFELLRNVQNGAQLLGHRVGQDRQRGPKRPLIDPAVGSFCKVQGNHLLSKC